MKENLLLLKSVVKYLLKVLKIFCCWFIRTLKNEIYKYVTSVSKMCILINKMIKWINTTIDIIPQSKWSLLMKNLAYLLILIKRVARKILNLKFVMMLENQNIFAKYYIPNWSEEVFVIKRLKSCTVDISY